MLINFGFLSNFTPYFILLPFPLPRVFHNFQAHLGQIPCELLPSPEHGAFRSFDQSVVSVRV